MQPFNDNPHVSSGQFSDEHAGHGSRKRGDNIIPVLTPMSILNMALPSIVLTAASVSHCVNHWQRHIHTHIIDLRGHLQSKPWAFSMDLHSGTLKCPSDAILKQGLIEPKNQAPITRAHTKTLLTHQNPKKEKKTRKKKASTCEPWSKLLT